MDSLIGDGSMRPMDQSMNRFMDHETGPSSGQPASALWPTPSDPLLQLQLSLLQLAHSFRFLGIKSHPWWRARARNCNGGWLQLHCNCNSSLQLQLLLGATALQLQLQQ